MRENFSFIKITVIFLFFLCIGFVIIPLLHLIFTTSFHKFLETLTDKDVWDAIKTSFISAGGATLIGLILAIPGAYFLARYQFKGKEIIESMLNIPIIIPHVAVGIILLNLLNENAVLGKFFKILHISFVDTIYGIMVAMCFVSISYIISSVILGFRAITPELEAAARTLGATPWYTFYKITLPLLIPSIVRGSILAFARSVSEIGAILIIAYYPMTAPVLLYERFENYGLENAKPITILIILLSLILFTILMIIFKKIGEKHASQGYN